MSPRSHVTVGSVANRLASKVTARLYEKAAFGLIEEPTELSDGKTSVVVWPQADVEEALYQIVLEDWLRQPTEHAPIPPHDSESEIA